MKKELLFSFVGHFAIFLILFGFSRPHSRNKAYPAEVFTVSVVSLEPSSPISTSGTAVSFVDKKPSKIKPKEPKTTTKSTQKMSGTDKGSGLGLKGLKIGGSKGGRYSYYIEAILKKIGTNWVNPLEGSGIKFSTTIYFIIEKDGRITSVKIEKCSGNDLYDRSAERAVIVTQMLPPLAGEFAKEESLRLHLEFEYKP